MLSRSRGNHNHCPSVDPDPANQTLAPLPNTRQQNIDFRKMASGGNIANYHVLVEMGIVPAVLDPDGIAAANLIQPIVTPDFNERLIVTMEDGSNVRVTKNPAGSCNQYKVSGFSNFEAKNKTQLDAKLSKLTNDRWGLSHFDTDIPTLPPSTWPQDIAYEEESAKPD